MQPAGIVNAFRAKKSIQPAAVAPEPGGEEANDDMGSQDPKAQDCGGELGLDNRLHNVVVRSPLRVCKTP